MTESTEQTVDEPTAADVESTPEHDTGSTDTQSDGAEPVAAAQSEEQDESTEQEESADEGGRVDQLEAEGDIAADYLEELLDIADFDGDLDMDVEGDRAAVSISGGDLSALVGKDGQVLEAIQELTRLAVYQVTGERSRLMLDIDGHRASRRAAVEQVARTAVERAKESEEAQHLQAMSPFERKVAHDVVAAAGLTSESEGVEPRRHVVVLPHD